LPAPNPFRDRAILDLALARASRVHVEVFSVDGRRVRTITEREFEPGVHHLAWDGHDEQGRLASAGVYFVRASADHLVFTRRVTLLK
jgi:flagellar hook assembly protein FlgD